jgi:hypothetical protein
MNDNATQNPNKTRESTLFFSEKYIASANKKNTPPKVSDEKRQAMYGMNHNNSDKARYIVRCLGFWILAAVLLTKSNIATNESVAANIRIAKEMIKGSVTDNFAKNLRNAKHIAG